MSIVLFNIACVGCGEVHSITVTEKDLNDWNNGVLIQNAFPYLDPATRELLKSQICGDCWDKMFGGFE